MENDDDDDDDHGKCFKEQTTDNASLKSSNKNENFTRYFSCLAM